MCNWQNHPARMRVKGRESQINKNNEFPTKKTKPCELLKDTLQKPRKEPQKVSNATGPGDQAQWSIHRCECGNRVGGHCWLTCPL